MERIEKIGALITSVVITATWLVIMITNPYPTIGTRAIEIMVLSASVLSVIASANELYNYKKKKNNGKQES